MGPVGFRGNGDPGAGVNAPVDGSTASGGSDATRSVVWETVPSPRGERARCVGTFEAHLRTRPAERGELVPS